jgi:hypothetical protein
MKSIENDFQLIDLSDRDISQVKGGFSQTKNASSQSREVLTYSSLILGDQPPVTSAFGFKEVNGKVENYSPEQVVEHLNEKLGSLSFL